MARTLFTLNQQDLPRVKTVGETIRKLLDELNDIYPEREKLMEMIVYALLTREHVMIFGPKGTGKSDLFSSLMDSIEDAVTFRITLSKYSTETAIFGIPNPKRMKDEGVIEYDPSNNILSANYVELDEVLDANDFLLRIFLSLLNERCWKRGHKVYAAKLMTAVATTNCVPEEEVRANSRLEAVLDRFMFQTAVKYLEKEESRRRMYARYLCGATPVTKVSLDDITFISNIVVNANQITDPYFVEVYDRVLQAYRNELGDNEKVSDRRACKLLQIAEASALLFGRYEVHPSDIYAIQHGLCYGNPEKIEMFMRVATPIIEEANQKMQQNIDEVQTKLLSELEVQIPESLPAGTDGNQLVGRKRELITLRGKVDGVKPELACTNDRKREILRKIDSLVYDVQKQIDGVPQP